MILRSREYPLTGRLLQGCLNEHLPGTGNLSRLREHYDGDAPITQRVRGDGLPNNRLAHGYARYIVTVASSYLVGGAVRYDSDERKRGALDGLLSAYRAADIASVDIELAKNASLYGRGVEYVYIDRAAQARSVSLDPRAAFVAYSDDAEKRPLFGVLFQPLTDIDGAPRGWEATVCTERETLLYRSDKFSSLLMGAPCARQRHYFGRVPMIEYWNNDDCESDLKGVLSLMDAYDVLESDRVNDHEQLVNALLVIYGARIETDSRGRSPAQQLRQDKLLYLPDREAGAQYLSRPDGGGDLETLRAALSRDIHKFSMIPDLTDDDFRDNVSGVALKYKLLPLEQLCRVKERWFREALRERLRCYAAFLAVKGGREFDPHRVRMTFSRALPVDELEAAQTVKTLENIVPKEELAAHLPFMDGAQNT